MSQQAVSAIQNSAQEHSPKKQKGQKQKQHGRLTTPILNQNCSKSLPTICKNVEIVKTYAL
jgi:hypothetical protein